MTEYPTPSFAAVADALRQAGSGADPAEVHGSLCGMTCVLGEEARGSWLAEVCARPDELDPGSEDVLSTLANGTWECLAEGDLSFYPLLPPEGDPLAERADRLALWCQGFSHGLTAGADQGEAGAELGRGVTAEILRDFGEFSRMAFGPDEDEAEGEAAYAELVEYVRASVQLVFEELGALRERLARSSLH